MDTTEIIKIAITVVVLIIAIVGHEIMHGFVAYKYGDNTAKDAGRLSINPIVHIDPIGTIVVPTLLYLSSAGFLFGWAKPVPVDIRTVIARGGFTAAMAVALAGIFYNLVLALLSSLIFVNYFPMELFNEIISSNPEASTLGIMHYLITKMLVQDPFLYFIGMSLIVNLLLAVFNLLPIPAFDGAQFLTYLSFKLGFNKVAQAYIKLAPYGMFIVLAIFMVGPLQKILIFEPLNWLLSQLIL